MVAPLAVVVGVVVAVSRRYQISTVDTAKARVAGSTSQVLCVLVGFQAVTSVARTMVTGVVTPATGSLALLVLVLTASFAIAVGALLLSFVGLVDVLGVGGLFIWANVRRS